MASYGNLCHQLCCKESIVSICLLQPSGQPAIDESNTNQYHQSGPVGDFGILHQPQIEVHNWGWVPHGYIYWTQKKTQESFPWRSRLLVAIQPIYCIYITYIHFFALPLPIIQWFKPIQSHISRKPRPSPRQLLTVLDRECHQVSVPPSFWTPW